MNNRRLKPGSPAGIRTVLNRQTVPAVGRETLICPRHHPICLLVEERDQLQPLRYWWQQMTPGAIRQGTVASWS